jgi:hypothetical protein
MPVEIFKAHIAAGTLESVGVTPVDMRVGLPRIDGPLFRRRFPVHAGLDERAKKEGFGQDFENFLQIGERRGKPLAGNAVMRAQRKANADCDPRERQAARRWKPPISMRRIGMRRFPKCAPCASRWRNSKR